MAHIDAGKTTTTERVLYYTGKTYKIGEVHDGAATMDFMEQERSAASRSRRPRPPASGTAATARSAASTSSTRQATSTSRSRSSVRLRVLDGAVCVLDANQGVEPQTETVWRQGDKYNVPRIIFANKMDKTGADFFMCVADIKESSAPSLCRCSFRSAPRPPSRASSTCMGMKAIIWDGDGKDAKMARSEIPADLADKAAEYRARMIEAAVEMDDDAMAAYLDGKEPDVDTLRKLIRKATVKSVFYPMLCGSAFKYKGVQPLLDAVVDFLPSPADREAFKGIDPKTGEPRSCAGRSTASRCRCWRSRS